MTAGARSVQESGQPLPARRFPMRTCVACRAERQKRDFVRVVRAPDGTVSLDENGRANGRGAYLCADGSCWSLALKKKSIERALSVSLAPELRVRLEAGPASGAQVTGGGTDGPQ